MFFFIELMFVIFVSKYVQRIKKSFGWSVFIFYFINFSFNL